MVAWQPHVDDKTTRKWERLGKKYLHHKHHFSKFAYTYFLGWLKVLDNSQTLSITEEKIYSIFIE